LYDVLLALMALAPLAYAIHKAETDKDDVWVWRLSAVGAFVCAVTLAKIVATIVKQGMAESRHDLEGCLHTLHSILTDGVEQEHGLRITVHVPVVRKKNKMLQQVTEYVGDPRGNHRGKSAGRVLASNKGIIGRALGSATTDCLVASRDTENLPTYIAALQEEWHFTEVEARRLDASAMSWMTIRLKDGEGNVQGIVYCDSILKDFFTEERQGLAIATCAGIARFVRKRYK
jgi:hypothetical protein